MADTATTPPPAAADNATIVYTFEEQATASAVLYGLSLFCIVVGSVRSSRFVKRIITRGQNKIESSITMREARFFPITASLVLFGLYCFFNPDKMTWSNVEAHLPSKAFELLTPLREKYLAHASAPAGEPLYGRLIAHLPENVRVPVDQFVEEAILPFWAYVPTITKAHCMKFLLVLLCVEGCVSLAALLKPFFSFFLRFLPNTPYLFSVKKGKKAMEEGDIEFAKKKDIEYLFKVEWDTHDAIAIAFCLIVGISHLYNRHWITNNILGVAFSIYGIENLHLSNFKGIDAPILLQFPQDIYRNGWVSANKYSMLGLGDIVIPGLFIALLRRFDQRIGELNFKAKDGNHQDEGKKKEKGPAQPPKQKFRIYFIVTCIAYALGLLITMAVMHHFKRAQPALLYLVPTCLIIPLFISVCRGEFSLLWNYSEDHLVDKEEETKKVTDEKKKN